jgi:serine/threonine-protein kinase
MLRLHPPSLRSPSLHTDAAGPAPDTFGRFRVLHPIGAGTLGPVFRAFDPDSDRLVAVKLFMLDLAPERVHQLVAELEGLLAANLTHPAIAAPLAVGIYDNHPYLAQEFVAADSLDIVIRESGPAPPADALRVAAQLAGALDFAAVVHIDHGALHPRDVLLSPDDTRITGLGIARAFEAVNVAAPVRRPYTPSERIAGGDWDRRADIFSLAALMYELLWGRRVSATGAQAAGSLTDIAGADLAVLRRVFARGLAERPEERFTTALEFAEGLRQAFPGVIVREPSSAGGRQAPVVRREEAVLRLPLDAPVEPERSVRPGRARRREPEPDDLELREADRARYEDVETSPAIVDVASELPDEVAPMQAPGGLLSGYTDAQMTSPDRSQSAIWPIALALVLGVAIGFGGGYFVANFERPLPVAPVAAVQTPAPQAIGGREFTEGVIGDPAKTAPAGGEARARPERSTSRSRRPRA